MDWDAAQEKTPCDPIQFIPSDSLGHQNIQAALHSLIEYK